MAGLAFVLAFAVACGDDNGGTPGKEAGAKEAGAEAGTGAEAGAEAGVAKDQCLNAADGAKLDTEAKRDDVASKAGSCGLNCLGNPDNNCAKDCVVKDTGLSDGCSQCYADTIACATKNCLTECVGGTSSPACVSCRMTNCDPAFLACSGLSSGSSEAGPSEAGPTEAGPAEAGAEAGAGG
ncbi:MAG: hypothetical protein KC503_35895 [Myxococcales bacterium]|nr:hypothetical protein [Myxococcales bacterium]